MFIIYILENTEGIEYRNNQPVISLIRQFDIPEEQIYTDETYDRPEMKQMIKAISLGDTLMIRSVQDIADSLSELTDILKELSEKGVTLYSCAEPFLCGDDYLNYLNGYIKLYLYYNKKKKESGYKKAVAEGRVGRPPTNKDIERAIELYNSNNVTLAQIQVLTGVSKSTLYRYLKTSDKKNV